MDFLTRLNASSPPFTSSDSILFEIGSLCIFSNATSNLNSKEYVDVCGYLLKESDSICVKKNDKYVSCTRDDLRTALIVMNSQSPLKPTEESSSTLYKMLAGCKKKKSKTSRKDDEDEDLEEDDEEILRIVRRKDSSKVAHVKLTKSKNENEDKEDEKDSEDEASEVDQEDDKGDEEEEGEGEDEEEEDEDDET